MDLQMEIMDIREKEKGQQAGLQQQIASLTDELQLSNQNLDVMREALQVGYLFSGMICI